MNEQSITRRISNSLYTQLRRFVRQINETDPGTGTDDPRLRALTIREQYERECY